MSKVYKSFSVNFFCHPFKYPQISFSFIFLPYIKIAVLNIFAESLITMITEIVSIERLATSSYIGTSTIEIRIKVVTDVVYGTYVRIFAIIEFGAATRKVSSISGKIANIVNIVAPCCASLTVLAGAATQAIEPANKR